MIKCFCDERFFLNFCAWRPHKINKTTTKFGIHEQWIMYFSGGPGSHDLKGQEYGYIYVENGKVTSWQSWR